MEWQIILALVLGIPIILVPAALVWYFNASGIFTVIRETRKRRIARERRLRETVKVEAK